MKEFAATGSRVTKIPQEKFVTLIKESDPENVGVRVELLVNIQKQAK